MRCCFDTSEYTGVPDTEPCARTLDVPAVIRGLDALYAQSREDPKISAKSSQYSGVMS